MNALVFIVALGVCYAVTYGRRLLRRGTWWFSGGVALGLLLYAAAHILPDPAAYFAEQSFSLGIAHAMPIADLSLKSLLDSLRGEVARYDFYNHSLAFGLMAASLAYLACFRRTPRDRFFAAFVVSAFLGMVLMVRYKTPMYTVQTLPVLFLVVAEAMLHLADSLRKSHQGARAFVLSLLAFLVLTSAQHYRRALADYRGYDYYAITERIREAIPPGARVMGTPHWWLGLADCDYVSSANLTFFHYSRGYSLRQGLERLRPDVVIVDRYQRMLLTDENPFPRVHGPDVYLLPKTDFETFLAAQGREVLRFDNRWHGTFRVYAITWD